jgi:hypothetical protein
MLVRALSDPHHAGKGDAIIYSCKARACYMKPDRLIPVLLTEMAGRALRPSETGRVATKLS